MPSLIEVWDSRLGIAEVTGPQHNPIIVGWAKDIGWESIKDDETHWCAVSMCSAALEAGLPMPAHNTRPLARSWMTMGVTVKPEDAQPGDIMVEPRGNNGWSGHVSMIRHVKRDGGKTYVRNIGGNQTLKGTNGAVTLTGWRDIGAALPGGIRRMVPATVPALRQAGSSTIKAADTKEKVGILMVFFTPIMKGIEYVSGLFGPMDVPTFATLPEGFTWWQSVLSAANGVLDYAIAHPYLALTLIGGLALWGIARRDKSGRVAEHQAGVPIAAEVAQLQTAEA